MTKASNRTRPLDRDGDGADGGSLPGNQTAPYGGALIKGAFVDEASDLPIDDLADARTTPGDSPEKLEAIEREVDEANAAEWMKAAEGIKRLVQLRADAATAQTGEEAARLQGEADALAAELGLSEEEARSAVELSGADTPDTFTPEEVAAGAQVNEAEGEAPAVAAEPTVIPTDDPLVQIETETAPIAVRERELRLLVENRRLYKTAEGYSSNQAPPYVDEATVQAWISAGLAEDVPSAGNWGGVKPTHEARRQIGLIRYGDPA